ncbi:MAG TPA: HAMP domain-containing sensor histidine kinase [Eoetvoesiella sp.]
MSNRQIAPLWRRLWGSVAFRLTFNYGLLAMCTTIILLVFVYVQIVNVLQMQFSREITITAHRLVAHYKQKGRAALQAEIDELLSDQTDVDAEMYLLIGRQGEKLAGNLDLFLTSDFTKRAPEPVLLPVPRDGAQATGLLWIQSLDDGDTLVVGRDTHDLKEIKSLIGQASAAATLVALLLVLVGTYLFRRELRRRIEAIRETAIHVGTGELTRRIPAASQEDEFAHLRYDINRMLDRIEVLMNGVRNVSDSIAHNVRTPLARALAKLHKAQNSGADSAAMSEAIDFAVVEIMDLISVAEKLLLIAEAESGVRRQTFQAVQLDKIVEDVIDLYEALADEKDIVLEQKREGGSEAGHELWIHADADLLAGVIANLVENSIKYTGNGARITIKTAQYNGSARLTVHDDGPGVEGKYFALLGTRFFRVNLDTPGFGLGLASVRAIVSLHDGTISFRDAAPGFRVDIEFPIKKTPEKQAG